MSFTLDTKAAKSADAISQTIRESGKYIGTITRAEAIVSKMGTTGLGLSFKSDDGATAGYLDLWTHRANGEALMSFKTVSAIMACLKLRQVNQGPVTFERWDKESSQRVKMQGNGYPDIQGKRIGFLLRKEIETDDQGKDRDRVAIFGVFQADTELVASEVLDQKTKPERLTKMVEALEAWPINDKRKKTVASSHQSQSAGQDWADAEDDIPF